MSSVIISSSGADLRMRVHPLCKYSPSEKVRMNLLTPWMNWHDHFMRFYHLSMNTNDMNGRKLNISFDQPHASGWLGLWARGDGEKKNNCSTCKTKPFCRTPNAKKRVSTWKLKLNCEKTTWTWNLTSWW